MSPKKNSPICFYFGGNGAQWPGMGNALKNLPIFWNTIQRCHKVLEPKGVNLIQIITDDDPEMFEPSKIVNLTVGQTAIQVRSSDKFCGLLVDLLFIQHRLEWVCKG